MTEETPNKIITFYSYKGGTGRSMALANVAWVLACGGKKVLAIDWDLEAPGLHRYFYPFLIDKELTASDGVIDFVINFALEAVSPNRNEEPEIDWYVPHANIMRYAVSLNYEFPKGGRLDFVPAGRQGLSYATRVNSFDWEKFYERLNGGMFLEEVKKQMRDEYDYILIDSRTGFSDTSGICTIQMPDILVPCFTLNNQGIDGALRIAKTVFEKRRESGIEIFPVPMRLDNAENDKLKRRRHEAKDKFFPFPNYLTDGKWLTYWDEVPVFYVPYYSYEEVLAIFAQERTAVSMLTATEQLVKYLTHETVQKIDQEALPSVEECNRVLAIYAGQPVKIDIIAELTQVAENGLARLSPDDRIRARRVLSRLIRIARPQKDGADTRQRAPLDSFPLTELRLIQDLQNSRLLLIEKDSITGKETAQIAQDEFLRGWQPWIQEDREFLLWLSDLRSAQEAWQRVKSNVSLGSNAVADSDNLLLDGDDLAAALNWLKDRYADIYPAERDYIEKSRRKRDPKAESSNLPIEPKTKYVHPRPGNANVEQALEILRGRQAEPREMLELAKRLKSETRFSYARRLLARASKHASVDRDKKLRLNIFHQLALCTYKDQDLPIDERLNRGLDILNQIEDFAVTTDQETLGLLGSIYKRKWEVDSQRQNLERSLYYYLRGYEQGLANDQGYTGINAAFVMDQLASLEEGETKNSGDSSSSAGQRRSKAREIRQNIIEQVGALISDPNHKWVTNQWWYYATLAEAHFGLQNYDDAVRWLSDGQAATAGEVYEWELETSARQLAALAILQDNQNLEGEDFAFTPAWAALEKAFGANAVPRTEFLGKIGLALSGGGFRASLYHLGVLARLAELDVLRHVEVISCVSGGSIVGAYYYLMARRLLQSKTQEEITRGDYIAIVHEMIDQFVAGVQENIRMSIPLNPLKNLRMFLKNDYSRTARAGELYEQCLYSRIKDGEQNEERWLNGLTISPLIKQPDGSISNDTDFAPKYQNWRRDAKIPILILNAATLNTGHTWQFTASWMGESPAGIDSEIDGNDRLRRMYYPEAPAEHQQIRLGHAVGASAAVPGIFEPLTLDYLYPDRIIRLVDGGVCDNQGTAGLLEQDCKVMLVSDASGQMNSQPAASRSIFGVLLRTYDVFQARIRTAEYHDLKGRRRSGLLRGLMFVHLKGDLEVDPVDWINCLDPYNASDDARPPSRSGRLTRYGIAKDIQELLSGIRTDLDSFSDAEAYALMTSAYRMTEYQFKYENCVAGFPDSSQAESWKFLEIEESMKGKGAKYDYLKKLLAAGGSIAFKVWKIDPFLKYTVRIALLIAAVLIAVFAYRQWNEPLPGFISQRGTAVLDALVRNLINMGEILITLTLSQIVSVIVSVIAALFSGYLLTRILASLVGDFLARNVLLVVRWKDTLRRVAIAAVVSTIGFVVALIHLYVFDRRFLRLGKLETLNKKEAAPNTQYSKAAGR